MTMSLKQSLGAVLSGLLLASMYVEAGSAAASPSLAARVVPAYQVQTVLEDALRTLPGARQVSSNEVAWQVPGLGEARLVVPTTEATSARCPRNRLCFWDETKYRGELRHYPRCPKKKTDYYLEGFRDRTESWRNNTGWTTWVYDYGLVDRDRLWTMNTGFDSPDVGKGKRNKADYFRC
jgi:hypothetical protein